MKLKHNQFHAQLPFSLLLLKYWEIVLSWLGEAQTIGRQGDAA